MVNTASFSDRTSTVRTGARLLHTNTKIIIIFMGGDGGRNYLDVYYTLK